MWEGSGTDLKKRRVVNTMLCSPFSVQFSLEHSKDDHGQALYQQVLGLELIQGGKGAGRGAADPASKPVESLRPV